MKIQTKRVKIGSVAVESGLVSMGDPCYLLTDKRYNTLIKKLEDTDYQKDVTGQIKATICAGRHKTEIGVAFGGFGGDGEYPVYGEYDMDDNLIRATIEFRE